MDYLKGAVIAACVNGLNVAAWFALGPWIPSAVTAFVALALTGVYGMDDRWRLVFGYWIVQVLVFTLWLLGLMGSGGTFLSLTGA